jgi:hypothetical protein
MAGVVIENADPTVCHFHGPHPMSIALAAMSTGMYNVLCTWGIVVLVCSQQLLHQFKKGTATNCCRGAVGGGS